MSNTDRLDLDRLIDAVGRRVLEAALGPPTTLPPGDLAAAFRDFAQGYAMILSVHAPAEAADAGG